MPVCPEELPRLRVQERLRRRREVVLVDPADLGDHAGDVTTTPAGVVGRAYIGFLTLLGGLLAQADKHRDGGDDDRGQALWRGVACDADLEEMEGEEAERAMGGVDDAFGPCRQFADEAR